VPHPEDGGRSGRNMSVSNLMFFRPCIIV